MGHPDEDRARLAGEATSAVTQTTGALSQGDAAVTGLVAQGATGAVSAIGKLLTGG